MTQADRVSYSQCAVHVGDNGRARTRQRVPSNYGIQHHTTPVKEICQKILGWDACREASRCSHLARIQGVAKRKWPSLVANISTRRLRGA
jgi:hypothetical protein